MTANAMKGDYEKCINQGMNDYITKPINPYLLYAKLFKWIENNRPVLDDSIIVTSESNSKIGGKNMNLNEKLFEISGVDTQLGLKQAGGRIEFYKMLLSHFLKNEKLTGEQFRKLLDSGDREETLRNIHTFKGTAGTIGATKLHQLTATIESNLLSGNKTIAEELLTDFNTDLNEILDGIDKVIEQGNTQQHSTQQDSTQKSEIISTQDLLLLLNDLRPRIEMCEAGISVEIDDLINQLDDPQTLQCLKSLKQHLSQFDFDAAILVIDDFMR